MSFRVPTRVPYPHSYRPDEFASADQFMEKLLHPGPNSLRPLFVVPFVKTYTCPVNVDHGTINTSSRAVLQIFPITFIDAGLSYADVGELIAQWMSVGLSSDSGLVCRKCHPDNKTMEEELVIQPLKSDSSTNRLTTRKQNLKIDLTDPTAAPLHLYFHLEGVAGLEDQDRADFQGKTNWPARILIGEVEYFMMTRGYWRDYHYWCKVVRSVEGILGVWHYDEAQNGGIAQLLDRNVTSIGGCNKGTSWVCYSRVPFRDEQTKISDSIRGLMKKFPKQSHLIPFSMPLERFPVGGGLPALDDPTDDGEEERGDEEGKHIADEDKENKEFQATKDEATHEKPNTEMKPNVHPSQPLKIKLKVTRSPKTKTQQTNTEDKDVKPSKSSPIIHLVCLLTDSGL